MPMMNALRAAGFGPEAFMPGISHHVFLIAVRGESQPPILHRGTPLSPMQIVLTGVGEPPPFADWESAVGPLPALPAPQRLMRSAHPVTLIPREVTGEILRDGTGKLYEKIGDYVRPVHQLFTGARGEMIDLAPVRDVTPPPVAATLAKEQEHTSTSSGELLPAGATDQCARVDSDAGEHAPQRPFRDLARRLVPEPGLWRLVRYADFIDAITPQLADPRRLQPGHQLACYVQIYELATMLSSAVLEDAAARELGSAGKLLPLSYDLCRRFALSLPRPAFAVAATQRVYAPDMVPAGARFITLRVALDPTAEVAAPPRVQPDFAAPRTNASPQDAPPTSAIAPASAPRTSIPEEFVKPWDLRLSRDEAVYDMTLATGRGAWRRFLDRLFDRVSRRDMTKWHALLVGKTPDQQLWAVKPPRGSLGDARIRRWVEQTLQVGGYDVARMQVEWEIHWRRQGL